MWDSLSPILTGVLAVAAGLAALFAGQKIGTERTLRESNSDLRERVKDLEAERERDKSEKSQIRAEVAEVKANNDLLESMIQGRVEWVTISDQMTELTRVLIHAGEQIEAHDSKAEEWWTVAGDHLRRIEQLMKTDR